MAAFDQRPNPNQPDNFLGYSRGIDSTSNDAIGTLFDTVAGTFEAGVKTADRLQQHNIRQEIYKNVDDIQAEFGVSDATLFEEDTPKKDPLPSQLASAGENLDRLQAAYERGALKESHYWARLNSMVRQLRQKYPGYRPEIDEMVAGVTGAQPANALRNALFDEWNAAASETSPLAKIEDWALKEGRLPPDYYKRQEEGTPYTLTELKSYVASKERNEAERADRRSSLAEMTENENLNGKDAERAFRVEANQIVLSVLGDTSKAVGRNYATLTKKISEAQLAAAAGNPIPQQELEQLRGAMGELVLSVRQQLQSEYLQPWDDNPDHSYVQFIDSENSQKIIDQAMMPVTLLENALNSENPWGVLKSVTAYTEAMQNDATRQLIENVPMIQTLKGVSDVLGPDGTSLYMSLNPDLQNALAKALLDYQASRAVVDPNASVTDAFADGEARDMEPEYYNGLVDRWTDLVDQLETGELPMEVFQKNVDFMFGPKAMEVLAHMDDPSRFEYFTKVASPMVTQQMLKMKSAGDVESWDNYQQWVSRSFLTLFQSKVQTLQQASTSIFHPGMSVTWDAANSQFRLLDPNPAMLGQPGIFGIGGTQLSAGLGGLDQTTAAGALREMNAAIAVVKPIIEENGGEAGGEILALLTQMGFNPEDQQTFLGMIMRSLVDVAEEQMKEKPTTNG